MKMIAMQMIEMEVIAMQVIAMEVIAIQLDAFDGSTESEIRRHLHKRTKHRTAIRVDPNWPINHCVAAVVR